MLDFVSGQSDHSTYLGRTAKEDVSSVPKNDRFVRITELDVNRGESPVPAHILVNFFETVRQLDWIRILLFLRLI